MDNDAARAAYFKGVGLFVDSFVQLELELQVKSWFSGVRSNSNIGDDPSRLNFKTVDEMGASKVFIDWSFVASVLAVQESLSNG